MSTDIHADLLDVPARVGLIIHLRTMVVDGVADDAVEDLFEDLDANVLIKLWPNIPVDVLDSFEHREWGEIAEWIEEASIFGFIVRFETPKVSPSGSYSWGYYTSTIVYAETFEDAVRAGVAWATLEREKRSGP